MDQGTLEIVRDTLSHALPEGCMERGVIGSHIVANECVDAFLVEKGWARDCFGAMTLFTSIAAGDWKIPQHIHDRVCGCQERRAKSTRDRIMAPMWNLITAWGLPTKENPKSEQGVTYYAEAGGSRKYPLIMVKFFKGESYHSARSGGSASWNPRQGLWGAHVFYDEGGKLASHYLPATVHRDKAIRTVLEAVQQR